MNKEGHIKKYCKICKQYHEVIVKKRFVEECTEEEYEAPAHWVTTYHWNKKDRIEMLTHNLLALNLKIKKTELNIKKHKIEEKKVIPECSLIPVYVDPILIDKIYLPKLIFEREVIKKLLRDM